MASFDLSSPAMAAPDGITPNFDDPPNGNSIASASLILMMVISTLCILLRAYGKVYLTKKIYTEDGKAISRLKHAPIRWRKKPGSSQGKPCNLASYFQPRDSFHIVNLYITDQRACACDPRSNKMFIR